MNKNTNRWAVEVKNANLSEAIQTIAFSFGYKWIGDSESKLEKAITVKYLVFNPDTHQITWSTHWESLDVNEITSDLDRAMELFKNPPENEVKVGSNITVKMDGNVNVLGHVISGELFDKVVKQRDIILGKVTKHKLPVVMFTYTSVSTGTKLRKLLVTNMTADYIEGLDADDRYKYKKFLMDRMVGSLYFKGFDEEP